MSDFHYEPMFQLGADETEYRPLDAEGLVDTTMIGDREGLVIEPKVLRLLAAEAIRDVSHLFRPSHLAQLRAILDDPEASENDRFVAMEMLKNAVIASEMVLPSCQDTGTAIVHGDKGERVFTGVDDAEWLSHGIRDTYVGTNLRYSQMAPLSMFEERNTGTNLPAQIEIESVPGDEYELLGGFRANDFQALQVRPVVLLVSQLRQISLVHPDRRTDQGFNRRSTLQPGESQKNILFMYPILLNLFLI